MTDEIVRVEMDGDPEILHIQVPKLRRFADPRGFFEMIDYMEYKRVPGLCGLTYVHYKKKEK